MTSSCKDFLLFLEVNNPKPIIGDLFERKFGSPFNVNYGHHQIAFYKKNAQHFIPIGYLNLLPYKKVILVGGGMTDGNAFKHVSPDHSKQISEAGGILYLGLKHAFSYYSDDCIAFFGHVNNKRAYEVDIKAGFIETGHKNLVVNFHNPISPWRKKRLIKMVTHLGPF